MVWQALANPQTLSAIASIGSSVLGGMSGGSNKTPERLAKDAVRIAGTAYSPISVGTPTGQGITFGGSPNVSGVAYGEPYGASGTNQWQQNVEFPGAGKITQIAPGYRQVGKYGIQSDIGNVNLSYGDLTNPRLDLGALAGQLTGSAGLQGLSPLQLLGMGLAGQGSEFAGVDAGTLNSLLGLTGQATGYGTNALANAYQNPFQQGLMETLFSGAGNQFGDAARGFEDYRQSTLDLLRQQAQPQIERDTANFNNNLFATGQLGSTGGALRTEAFARGLGQADLDRQLAASEEARKAQTQSLAVGQDLGNFGSSLQELQNSILEGSVGRFNTLSSLAQSLSNARQQQALNAGEYGSGLVKLGEQAALSPYNVQQGALGNLEQVLRNAGLIQGQSIDLANLARQFMSDQANVRSGQASAATAGASVPQTPSASGALWTSLASALGDRAGGDPLGTLLDAVFGK